MGIVEYCFAWTAASLCECRSDLQGSIVKRVAQQRVFRYANVIVCQVRDRLSMTLGGAITVTALCQQLTFTSL